MPQHDIILIAAEPWENYTWRRRHQVAWALSTNHRVLFVEPPYTVLSPFRNSYISWKQLFNLGRMKHRGRNLYSYSPFKFLPLTLPFSQRFNYDEINKKIIFSQLKHVARRLKINKPILWTYFSMEQYEYYDLFDEILTVTDYYDKFTAPFGWEKSQTGQMRIYELEKKLLGRANIAFAPSIELFDYIKGVNSNSYHIPHGVDIEIYLKKEKGNHGIFRRLDKLGKPILGYLGAIQHKIDFNLLEYISVSHPEWSLVFVGKEAINNEKDQADWNRLISKENVYYFSEIDRRFIPSVLEYFDICIIPFKKIEWTHYATPLKIWEYLAAGKPIVAINQNADYGSISHLIYIVDDKQGFERGIQKILSEEEDDKFRKERINFTKSNTWDHRVEQMMRIIDEFLSRNE